MVRSIFRSLGDFALVPFLATAVTSSPVAPVWGDVPSHGAVASQHEICSNIGLQLLREGGNAADAQVGTVLCVGTLGMYHSGIGGGGFMLVRSGNGTYEVIDFREMAPAAAFQDMFKENPDLSTTGGLASGVPGELRGLEYLHQHYGELSWEHVVTPAIKLAREGWEVFQDMVDMFAYVTPNTDFLVNDPAWAVDFAPNGTLVKLGDTMTRKRYADTLEVIAKQGVDAFYTGAIANATIAAVQAANGTMKMEDLKNYSVALRKPLQIQYGPYKLTSTSAPSSGAVALSALNTVSGYEGFFSDASQDNLSYHRLDEAIRFAYGQRTKMGDPSFVVGMEEYTEQMISPATGKLTRSKISDFRTQNVSYYDPEGLETINTPGTSHIVAADSSGLAVSMTTTVNLLFGSHVMVPETGIIMNNEMGDFSIPGVSNSFGYIPTPANYVRPGKRPLSSISPIIAELDGKLYLALGAAGGSRITTANIQNTIYILSEGLGCHDALSKPRMHDQLNPNHVEFEWAFDNSTVAYMKSLGVNVTWVAPGASDAQAIRLLPNGTFEAAGEPRQKSSGGFAI